MKLETPGPLSSEPGISFFLKRLKKRFLWALFLWMVAAALLILLRSFAPLRLPCPFFRRRLAFGFKQAQSMWVETSCGQELVCSDSCRATGGIIHARF
ncbi:hypothetical protein FZ025_14690 [Xanthomonas hyacinthi]|uniref:hypothetical protein n=1 Tax=Xanthomonas hyacinthi TaxID=56455 RepID=UPI0011B04C3A|nr:hypothetical protein [Xanthomonas hyacinthi]QGY77825.1 hypothetical protein FZ025_14690 [Xanthomonas hyacinthi]